MTDDMPHGLCRDRLDLVDAVYSPPSGAYGTTIRKAAVRAHIALCRRCPLITACYAAAVEVVEYGPHSHGPRHGCAGVWGGVDWGANQPASNEEEAS